MGKTIHRITLLGCYNSMASTLFGPMDIFNQAGRLWNRLGKLPQTPFFEVSIASADGRPIRCLNNVMVQPHCSIDAVDETDLIVIASATYIDRILTTGPAWCPGFAASMPGAPMWPVSAPVSSSWPRPVFWTDGRPPCIGVLPTSSAAVIPG